MPDDLDRTIAHIRAEATPIPSAVVAELRRVADTQRLAESWLRVCPRCQDDVHVESLTILGWPHEGNKICAACAQDDAIASGKRLHQMRDRSTHF